MEDNLITTVKQIRDINGLSDRQMAIKIGIDPGHFSRFLRGIVPAGKKIIDGLAREFPESKLAVMNSIGQVKVTQEPTKQEAK